MSDLSLQRVGPVYGGTGTAPPFTAEPSGAQRVSDGHARFYDVVRQGNGYYASMVANAALGTALTATAVTLTLYNPLNSGIWMIIWNAQVTIGTVITAAGNSEISWAANTNVLAAAPTSVTVAANFGNCLLGGPVGKGKAYTAATLPAAPLRIRGVGSIGAVGTLASLISDSFVDNVDGALILAPNTAVTIQNVGTAISGTASIFWEEAPVLL